MGNKQKDRVQGSREPCEVGHCSCGCDTTTVEGSIVSKDLNPLESQVGGSHYKGFVIQPVEYILANDIPFIEGSVIKYVSRWKDKGGTEDLEKAIHLLEILIEHSK
jgi:hypothetical protein